MRAKKSKKNTKLIVTIILLAFISIAAGMGLRIYTILHAKPDDIVTQIEKTIDSGSAQYATLKEQGRFNILIMGEDDVEGSRRSDTVLFATIDIDDKNMRVLALPRDTRVEIPRHGYQKLNHAFAYGGADLMKATIERYLDEPILYYVIVDYDSFPTLVDAIGGVEIDVPKRLKYVDRAGDLNIDIPAGKQVMDGKTALHFVRFRMDALGDIGRIQRQQQFMKALLKKAYDPRTIVKLPDITAQMVKLFKTDMSPTLAVQLVGYVQNEMGRERIFFSTLHGKPITMDKLSYWLGDPQAAKNFLNAPVETLLTGELEQKGERFAGISLGYSSAADENGVRPSSGDGAPLQQNQTTMTKEELFGQIKAVADPVAVLNGSGKSGLSSEVSTKLQKIGIDVVRTGNAKHFDYKYTNVVYPPNASQHVIESAKSLGKLLGVANNLVRPNNQAAYVSLIVGHDSKTLLEKLDNIIKTSLQ